ncbi:MAG: NUDIX domain-containing protein [Candidatus Saccharimonas sp.]
MILQVGVKVLLANENSEYLFLRRAASTEAGLLWDIPGGRIESHEFLDDALAREVYEETSMKLGGNPLLLAAQDIMVPSKDLHVVRLTYSGTAKGQVMLSDEHDEYRWMSKAAVLGESHVDAYLRSVLESDLLK